MNRIQALSRIFSAVFLITLLSKCLAVTKETSFAHVFGASAQSDAFIAASTVSFILIATLAASFETSIVAVYAKVLHQGHVQSKAAFLSTVLAGTILLGLALTGLYVCLQSPILHLLTPGFTADNTALTIRLGTILAPCIFLFLFIRIATALIETTEKFLITGLSNIVFNGGVTIGLYALSVKSIETLAWITLIALSAQAVLLLAKLIYEMKGLFGSLKQRADSESVRHIMKLTIPNIAILALGQLILFLERILGSYLEPGELTSYYFAGKIQLLSIGLLVTPILTIWYPKLSKARYESQASFSRSFAVLVNWMNAIMLPVVGLLLIQHRHVVEFLFQYGSFTSKDTLATSHLLLILSPSLLFMAQKVVFERLWILNNQAWALIRYAAAGLLLNAALDIGLFAWIGVSALAWGTLASCVISTLWMAYGLKDQWLKKDAAAIRSHLIVTAVCTGIGLGMVLLAEQLLSSISGHAGWLRSVGWIASSAVGLAAYAAAQFYLQHLLKYVRKGGILVEK